MVNIFRVTPDSSFNGGDISTRCAFGESGMIELDDKKESDGGSPIGVWPLRHVYYRPDRLERPETGLEVIELQPDDGWCDDSDDSMYNQHVKLPYDASHEELWRQNHTYDIIVKLGFNDDPIVSGLGSAIFFHIAEPGYPPTKGCIAISMEDMLQVLAASDSETKLEISR